MEVCMEIHENFANYLSSIKMYIAHMTIFVPKYDGRRRHPDIKAQSPDSSGNDITENMLQRLQC